MFSKITYDNVVKGLITISLLFMAFGAKAADFSGNIGINSDNYFRGINISDGLGYSAMAKVDEGNLWGGVKVMSMEESSDLMTIAGLGYSKDIAGVGINVAYIEYGFEGMSLEGWEEVGVGADFGLFRVQYYKGLDDAGDTYGISTGILKVFDVAYGDSDLSGSWFEISRSFDLAGGKINVGYIDHEDNEDDFIDRVSDVDNFYVGYSYNF